MIVTDFLRLFPAFLRLEAQRERLEVQLAGCGTAAQGWARDFDLTSDAYGWSVSFQCVLDLRQKWEKADARTKEAESEIEALTSELVSNEEELSTVRAALDEERRRNSQLQDTVYRLQAQSDQASTRADEAVRNEVLAYKAIINMETQRTRGTVMFPEAAHLPKSLVDSPDPIQAPYVHGSQLVTTAKKKFRKQVEEVLTAKS